MTTFIIFKDRKKEWRWHATASNGRIVASSAGDGYKRKAALMKSLMAFVKNINVGKYAIGELTKD